HGKPGRRCRKAEQKAERNAVLADCRDDLCSCEGGAKSTCALPPTTTTSTTPPPTAPTTAPTTSTMEPTTLTPTSTTAPTTTTLPRGTASNPGAGLQSQITGATVSAAGTVVVTFTLTDAHGVPVTPVTAATSDPAQAQVRFTIARLDLDVETVRGFTNTFTRYSNYNTPRPGYDSGGGPPPPRPAPGPRTYTVPTTPPPPRPPR